MSPNGQVQVLPLLMEHSACHNKNQEHLRTGVYLLAQDAPPPNCLFRKMEKSDCGETMPVDSGASCDQVVFIVT